MRNINEMMKLIPPDELNGGITMKSTNRTDDNKSNISDSRREVKLKRGTSGLVAAALVLAVGGGALAVSLNRSGAKSDVSGAESITAAAGQSQSEADEAAKNIYKLITANIAARVEDGYLNQVATGAHTADLSAPDKSVKNMLARSLDPEKFTYKETIQHFSEATADIGALPASGEVFYRINAQYKVDFVQYRSTSGAVGQFSTFTDERTEFGKLPKLPETENKQESSIDFDNCSRAKAFYDIFNRMQNDYLNGEYPVNQNWAMLPPGQLLVLDLDNRYQYADTIWRMEQYNTENVEFTGKLFIEYALGNDPDFVAWQPAEGGLIEVWFCNDGATSFNPGDYPDNETAWNLKQGSGYSYDEADIEMIANEMGCERCILGAGRYVKGTITERSNMPEVFEWYESFLAGNFQPVKFNAKKLISPEKLDKFVKYDWIDTEKKEPVIIRTSDIEGANIYVNGRYYNVEDTSVLELLENGMPPAIKADFDDSSKPEETN
ncbi:MAG: hypothetical protein IJR91_08010 [Ruminococcus sp.]|nr:hypothetical protein [Ruminococcus sp.]